MRRARAGLALTAVTLMTAGCFAKTPPPPDLVALRAEHERLLREFQSMAARDPVAVEATREPADVVVAVRSGLVQDLVQEVALRYFDRVVLDLQLDAHASEARDVHVSTPLGTVNAGTWTVDVIIHRVHGVLGARVPRVQGGAANALRLEVPVVLREGGGTATIHFKWDGHSVGGMICHDFEVTRQLEGRLIPEEYPVSGSFLLQAGPETIRAEPSFPQHTFRFRADLVPASWASVRGALEEQDRILRCGLAIDPDEIMPRLAALLQRGFEVKLPQSLFRAVDLPAGIRRAVNVEERRVDLAVSTRALRVTPDAVWYAAEVHAGGGIGAAPGK